MKKIVQLRLPSFTEEQSKLVKGSFDFIGINHYSSMWVQDNSKAFETPLRDFNADFLAEFSCKVCFSFVRGLTCDADFTNHMLTDSWRSNATMQFQKICRRAVRYTSKCDSCFVVSNHGFVSVRLIFVKLWICWNQMIPTSLPTEPAGLQHCLEYIRDAYGNPPVYVEENG